MNIASNIYILFFMIILLMAVYSRFKVLMIYFIDQGHRFPFRSSLLTFLVLVAITTGGAIYISISLDLVYSLWTDQMLAIALAVLYFALIPIAYKIARKVVHELEVNLNNTEISKVS